MIWVLMKAPDGEDFLLHLDAMAGIKRENTKTNKAIAITTGGIAIPLGEDFDQLAGELTEPGDGTPDTVNAT